MGDVVKVGVIRKATEAEPRGFSPRSPVRNQMVQAHSARRIGKSGSDGAISVTS
ncbi:hypothetical protein SAMN04489725_101223 [Alicyclobacillus hesperidum]|uniref:Uncharacterized protein n=1 Tax=Alicyclobacillus hesperidum TaxID=89784 RepID=A0A1H2QGE0_9BACL|nr:hypothetical protein SAMN04489725_101223 [Alicyclobacillus hesperidum]